MMSKNKPIARHEEIVVQQLEDETLVYDLKDDKVYCLNQTSAMVWKYCNGKNSIAGIADVLSVETKSLISSEFVEFAIEGLKERNLLENNELETGLSNLSRREAVKRLGISTAIALPIISSMVAPASAQMGSCLPNGTLLTCSTDPATDPNCTEVLTGLFRCTEPACCTGFCAKQPSVNPTVGNCSN